MAADEDVPEAPAGQAAATSSLSRARRLGARRPSGLQPQPREVVHHQHPHGLAALTEPVTSAEAAAEQVAAAEAARAAGEEPKKSRAGRNLPAAIGVGVGLGLVILASLFLYTPSFAVIVALAVVYGSYELSHAIGTAGVRISLTPIMVGGVAMIVSAWERGPDGLVLALLLTVVGVFIWRVADGAENYGRDVAASSFIVLYLPALAGFAVLMVHADDGPARIVAFIVAVVCSDTGGYATGVLFGRHPLAPIVSKAKTWEGFAGSVLFCTLAGVLFLTLTFHQTWWEGALFGLAIVVTATLGDLGESMIKRDLGIKDMGRLLPGHGGIMDRLDSLLPCAAVAYLLLSAFAPV